MKKVNYFALQLILSLVLIAMGGLLEWKGTNVVSGTPHILFIIPGVSILLSFFVDLLKFKKFWIYILVYVAFYIVMTVVVLVGFKLELTAKVIAIAFGLMVLSVGISTLFHFIYEILKNPKRLFRF